MIIDIEEAYQLHLSGYNLAKLKDFYNVNRGYFEYHFKKNGYPIFSFNTKYIVNHSFFKKIDSEIKAYLLGFFFADGCINKDNRISITISKIDKEIVELFKQNICKEKEITEFINSKGALNRKPQVTWRINSKYIIQDLNKYGVFNNKTNIELNVPDIPNNLKLDFIRGYFDGDGWVRKDRYETGIVSPTLNILVEIKDILQNLNIKSRIAKYKNSIYRLEIYNKKNITNLYNAFYKNSSFYLNRKKKRFNGLVKKANTEVTKSIKTFSTVERRS